MKLKNLYREPVTDEHISAMRVHPDKAVLKTVLSSDFDAAEDKNRIILTGAQAEAKTGILFYRILAQGSNFAAMWDTKVGDTVLISHLAGDSLGKYCFVDAKHVHAVWGDNVFEDSNG